MNKRREFLIPIAMVIVLIIVYLTSSDETEKKGKISGAFRALQGWAVQRAYPGDDVPASGFYQAFEQTKLMQRSLSKSSASHPWEAIGPKNIGGRTLAIAFNPQNPNTIYAGSAGGGLWRSYTLGEGAQAWEHVSTAFPVLSVSSIAISPDDSNTMYIGTGEVYNSESTGTGYSIRATRGSYGIGILKTSDGGVAWEKSLDFSLDQRKGIEAIRLNPQNPNTVWAATTDGVYRSFDAGTSWTLVNSVIMAMDLAVNPVDTNIVFVTHGDLFSQGHGIYRTQDSGGSWEKLTAGLPATFGGKAVLSIFEADPSTIYVSIGFSHGGATATQLCRSTDGGDTWTLLSDFDYSIYQGWYSHFVGVHPTDSSKVIVGGIDIFKWIEDSGTFSQKTYWWKWSFGTVVPPGDPEGPADYSHADHHAMVFHPTDRDTIYFATDGGIFRTIDGGETYRSSNGGYQTTQFYSGFSSSRLDSNLAMGGLQDNGSAIYYGGDGWMKVIGGDGAYSAINTSDDNIIYGSWYYRNILRSNDRGMNFFSNVSPQNTTNESLNFISPFVMSPTFPDHLYAGGSIVHSTTDGGASWTAGNNGNELDGNPVLTMAIAEIDPNVVYVATAPWYSRAHVFVTRDGGISWTDITQDLPDRYIVDLAVDPTDNNVVYAALSEFGSSHLFRSADGGLNWDDIGSGLPDIPTNAVLINPEDPARLYVGNDIGVYVSADTGNTWQTLMDGMPEAVIVMDLVISPQNRKLRVATHGSGVYQRQLPEAIVRVRPEPSAISQRFTLAQNYPNPFNPVTTIKYHNKVAATISLIIYDVNGREVERLSNGMQPAGVHVFEWNASNVSSGIYFYRLSAADFTETKKMILLK
ncbi:T9SS type A sorting domain-containing protein [Candidatus Marinimicrobia bacterium MT.SAG.2]|nr:T9SS type A sorting domain-containing protein [Candidatus Marinimicrobia bacterium MT.SAG.2]